MNLQGCMRIRPPCFQLGPPLGRYFAPDAQVSEYKMFNASLRSLTSTCSSRCRTVAGYREASCGEHEFLVSACQQAVVIMRKTSPWRAAELKRGPARDRPAAAKLSPDCPFAPA